MSEQIPNSQLPPFASVQGSVSIPGNITPEQLEEMKAKARELAIQQAFASQPPVPSFVPPQQQVVYVRRNLTVAELLLVLVVSCGVVFGVQMAGTFLMNTLPRIEIKLK